MMMRSHQRWIGLLAAILAVAALGAWRFLQPVSRIHAATSTVATGTSYLIILGVGDTADTAWDGSLTVTGATVEIIRGWRFAGTDAITGNTWKLSTRQGPSLNGPGPVQENGLIVKITSASGPVSFAVATGQGNFNFTSQDVAFGISKSFLNGKALVTQTGTQFQLTNTNEDDDFPAAAQSGDDVYLTYTEFVHGDRTQATGQGTPKPITDFTPLARPAGGDQILLWHYSIAQRTWTGPFAVTGSGEDAMRSAVAIDAQGRAWVFYSVQRSGNFDIYARSARADGSMSPEVRLTTDPGTDLFPVAATDSSGRVWVAWQGFRNNNLEILASVQNGDSFWPEAVISTSPASDWDPAIAAAPNGDVAISWDTYDKGDYDVYLRRVRFNRRIDLDPPIAVAATAAFEARSSLAFDPQSRLWIAYEVAGSRWGKDFGAFDTTGLPLYSNHTIQVRCLVGNDLYSTADDVARVLPGAPATHLFLPSTRATFSYDPDPTLSGKRTANNGVGPPTGPRNSFPRLVTDSDGTVYLAFREPAGSGLSSARATGGVSLGSIWTGAMVYYDGAQWHGPGEMAFTDAVSDNRPVILPTAPGRLLVLHSSDHRLSPAFTGGTPQNDPINYDVFQSEISITRSQQPPALQRIGQITPDSPDSSAGAEADAAVRSRSYRPVVGGQGMQLMRGDFHRHTEISWDGRNDGPLIDAYRYYIDAAALDWAGCCDHDNGEAREYTWWLMQKFADAYLLSSRYVPMFYYERSVAYPEGHRNVIFAKRGVRVLPRLPTTDPSSPPNPAPDTDMLYQYLRFFGGMSAPHTSATDQGTDWRNHDPQVETFVEIYQGDRQDYEMPGAPRANTASDSISGYEASGYVSNALDKGIQLGFEASSDHISTHISFTNLWVNTPTREGILDAMKKRHMYGSTDNIVADFRSGPHFMGDSFGTASPPVFSVRLLGMNDFQNVVLVKDGKVVYSTSGGRVLAFSFQDTAAQKGKISYYYVRGLQTDGQVVWVSPMWVTVQ
jgi:hypothetical protein